MTNAQGEYIWYELLTPDPEKSVAFYGAVMGWVARKADQEGMDYHILEKAGEGVGGLVPLMEEMRAGGAVPGWLGYVAVDDVDKSVAAITAAGGSVMMPAFDVPGVGRIAMIADPQGVPFYVMRGTADMVSKAFSVDQTGHCSWNELLTSDQDAALAFYSGQFGWQKDGAMSMGPMGEYSFIARDGVVIGAMMNCPPDGPAPHWNYYFRVADIDRAVSSVEAAGGTVTFGPEEVPGDEWVIQGVDPEGATFALVGARI